MSFCFTLSFYLFFSLEPAFSFCLYLQVLTDFVGAINEDWLYKCKIVQGSCKVGEEIVASFESMPHTTSAVALWLVKLDALIAPYVKRTCSERSQEACIRGNGLELKNSLLMGIADNVLNVVTYAFDSSWLET